MTLVVAIDGPAGTGKSSAARFLAQQLDFIYVDTGAIYRALAYLAEKRGVDPKDPKKLVALIPEIAIVVDSVQRCTRIIIDGKVIESELRSEKISRLSSLVSQHKIVREALLPIQRDLIKQIDNGAIFEGRDIGTVVFPNAPLKIFITANSETRAKRRYDELKNSSQSTYQEVLQEIKNRDERDETRSSAPMQKAHDAYVLDTSFMTLAEVTNKGLALIEDAKKKPISGSGLW